MAGKSSPRLVWICRILMTLDVIIICAGYVSWFQAKQQLVSPLIPRSTIYSILADSGENSFKISLLAAVVFLAGLWFYSFKKIRAAIVLFTAVVVIYGLLLLAPPARW